MKIFTVFSFTIQVFAVTVTAVGKAAKTLINCKNPSFPLPLMCSLSLYCHHLSQQGLNGQQTHSVTI